MFAYNMWFMDDASTPFRAQTIADTRQAAVDKARIIIEQNCDVEGNLELLEIANEVIH